VRVYAVLSDKMSDEALELFLEHQMAGLMVENWDRDEPDRAGSFTSSRLNSTPRRTRLVWRGRAE
jgi:hypothetical protein